MANNMEQDVKVNLDVTADTAQAQKQLDALNDKYKEIEKTQERVNKGADNISANSENSRSSGTSGKVTRVNVNTDEYRSRRQEQISEVYDEIKKVRLKEQEQMLKGAVQTVYNNLDTEDTNAVKRFISVGRSSYKGKEFPTIRSNLFEGLKDIKNNNYDPRMGVSASRLLDMLSDPNQKNIYGMSTDKIGEYIIDGIVRQVKQYQKGGKEQSTNDILPLQDIINSISRILNYDAKKDYPLYKNMEFGQKIFEIKDAIQKEIYKRVSEQIQMQIEAGDMQSDNTGAIELRKIQGARDYTKGPTLAESANDQIIHKDLTTYVQDRVQELLKEAGLDDKEKTHALSLQDLVNTIEKVMGNVDIPQASRNTTDEGPEGFYETSLNSMLQNIIRFSLLGKEMSKIDDAQYFLSPDVKTSLGYLNQLTDKLDENPLIKKILNPDMSIEDAQQYNDQLLEFLNQLLNVYMDYAKDLEGQAGAESVQFQVRTRIEELAKLIANAKTHGGDLSDASKATIWRDIVGFISEAGNRYDSTAVRSILSKNGINVAGNFPKGVLQNNGNKEKIGLPQYLTGSMPFFPNLNMKQDSELLTNEGKINLLENLLDQARQIQQYLLDKEDSESYNEDIVLQDQQELAALLRGIQDILAALDVEDRAKAEQYLKGYGVETINGKLDFVENFSEQDYIKDIDNIDAESKSSQEIANIINRLIEIQNRFVGLKHDSSAEEYNTMDEMQLEISALEELLKYWDEFYQNGKIGSPQNATREELENLLNELPASSDIQDLNLEAFNWTKDNHGNLVVTVSSLVQLLNQLKEVEIDPETRKDPEIVGQLDNIIATLTEKGKEKFAQEQEQELMDALNSMAMEYVNATKGQKSQITKNVKEQFGDSSELMSRWRAAIEEAKVKKQELETKQAEEDQYNDYLDGLVKSTEQDVEQMQSIIDAIDNTTLDTQNNGSQNQLENAADKIISAEENRQDIINEAQEKLQDEVQHTQDFVDEVQNGIDGQVQQIQKAVDSIEGATIDTPNMTVDSNGGKAKTSMETANAINRENSEIQQENGTLDTHIQNMNEATQAESQKVVVAGQLSNALGGEQQQVQQATQSIQEHNESVKDFVKNTKLNKNENGGYSIEPLKVNKVTSKGQHYYTDEHGNRVMSLTQMSNALEGGFNNTEYIAKIEKFWENAEKALKEKVDFNADYLGISESEFNKYASSAGRASRGNILHSMVDAMAKSGMKVGELSNGGWKQLFDVNGKYSDIAIQLLKEIEVEKQKLSKIGLGDEFIQLEDRIGSLLNALPQKNVEFSKLSEMPLGMVLKGSAGNIKVAGTFDQILNSDFGPIVSDTKNYSKVTGKQGFQLMGERLLVEANREELKRRIDNGENLGITKEELDKIGDETTLLVTHMSDKGTELVEVIGVTADSFYALAVKAQEIANGIGQPLTDEEKSLMGVVSPFKVVRGQTQNQIQKYGAYGASKDNPEKEAVQQQKYFDAYIKAQEALILKRKQLSDTEARQNIVGAESVAYHKLEEQKIKLLNDEANAVEKLEQARARLNITEEDETQDSDWFKNLNEKNQERLKRLQEYQKQSAQANDYRVSAEYFEAYRDNLNQQYALEEKLQKLRNDKSLLNENDAKDIPKIEALDVQIENLEESLSSTREEAQELVNVLQELEVLEIDIDTGEAKIKELNEAGEQLAHSQERAKALAEDRTRHENRTEEIDANFEAQQRRAELATTQAVNKYIQAYRDMHSLMEDQRRLEIQMQSQSGSQLAASQRLNENIQARINADQQILNLLDEQGQRLDGQLLTNEQIQRIENERSKIDSKFELDMSAIEASVEGEKGFIDQVIGGFKNQFAGFIDTSLAYQAIGEIRSIIRDVIDTTKQLDSAMVDIQIATGNTRDETRQLLIEYNELAYALGRTTQEVAQASNDWLRAGYEGAEAAKLTEASMMLSTLGMIDASEATTYLISTLKGWQISASEVVNVVDKLSVVICSVCTVMCIGHKSKSR